MLKEKHDQIPDGLETKVFTEKYLPEAFPLSDPLKADIKLGQLLSMSSGMHGEGGNPGIVNGVNQKLEPVPRADQPQDQDSTGSNLAAGTATVTVLAGGQTIVTFIDAAIPGAPTGFVQVCKVAGVGVAAGANFSFNVAGTPVTVPAGPPPGGTCGAPITVPAAMR